MKKLITKVVSPILFFLIISISQNRVSGESKADSILLSMAKKYQLGIKCDVNPQKAFKIYNYLATKGSSMAMNELGKMFKKGDGINQDLQTALQYFRQASDLGNISATCNLASMYQKGDGVNQDFTKAFELYDKAAQAGNVNGCYGAGYLTYKGFGIEQDYSKATDYFERGALKGDVNCEYMLACYYLTGHDNKQDFEKGKKYLEKSMKHGHAWIEDFTQYNVVDSLKQIALSDPKKWTDVKKGKINNVRRSFTNNANDSTLQGIWVGKLYTYDWSGKKIEKEQDVQFKITTLNHVISLKWLENSKQITSFNADKSGNVWIMQKNVQPDKNSPIRWVIANAGFDIENAKNNETLYANLQKYSVDSREPLYPTIAVLDRLVDNPITISSIYPNPFENTIRIDFDLANKQNISIEIFNVAGVKVYSGSKKNYPNGKNSTSIQVNLIKGIYTLYVNGDNYRCSQNIIRQ